MTIDPAFVTSRLNLLVEGREIHFLVFMSGQGRLVVAVTFTRESEASTGVPEGTKQSTVKNSPKNYIYNQPSID